MINKQVIVSTVKKNFKEPREKLLTANINLFLSMQLATMTTLLVKKSVIHCFSGGNRV